MDTRKVVILFLIVVAVIAYMALGAGLLRDRDGGGKPRKDYEAGEGMKRFEELTGRFRSKFQMEWMSGTCPRSDKTITIPGECELKVKPDSRRPTRFALQPVIQTGMAQICFAFSQKAVRACAVSDTEPKLELLDQEAKYTVTKDGGFLLFKCPSGQCRIAVN
jgi:hypothetical protein